MTYNLDLMRAVREQITKHPETHDQKGWGIRTKCGTTHCIAGWACALSGDAFSWQADDVGVEATAFVPRSGGFIEDRGQDLLGLDAFEANSLFFEVSNELALAKLDELIQKGESQP